MRIPGFLGSLFVPRVRTLTQRAGAVVGLLFTAAVFQGGGDPAARAADPPAGPQPPSLAIFPSAGLPIDGLSWFSEAAVDPAKATDAEVAELKARGVRPLAIIDGPRARASLDGKALLDGLTKRGFAGYLFDGRRPDFSTSVDGLLVEARRRDPRAVIYFRGPAARLPNIGAGLSGYITDGIFTEPGSPDGDTPPAMLDDMEGVRRLAALVEVKKRYRFPFIVADRVPVGHREQARGIARTLADRGFTPYVTVGGRGLGIGYREYIPRRILALYDGEEEPYVPLTLVHRGLAVVLEYYGYIVDYYDARKPLPTGDLASKYAGIVSWFGDDEMSQPRTYERWLEVQIASGLRVAMLSRPGFDPTTTFLARIGIVESSKKLVGPVTVTSTGKMIGFETRPTPQLRGLNNWRASQGEVHMELRDASGQTVTPVVTGSWGGMALSPYMIDLGLEDRIRWIVDPFAFITRALDLEPLPVPDTTTENGRRLLFIQIDGDAFHSYAEMPGRFFSGQIIQRDFLEKYPFPTTVSIVEAETSPTGVSAQHSEKLESIAKSIFAMPNVEVASHSYTHPLDWVLASQGQAFFPGTRDPVLSYPLPGYKYSAGREVTGSVRYINERLAPPDKPVKVMLWSGAALPEADALREVYAGKLWNMNGGNAETPSDAPTLSMVISLGRFVDGYLQIYSQEQNENVYTNEWHGPFYGFRRAVGSFKYTDSPRRLKPIDIYYHFYSGTKLAGISALHDVYQYAAAQDTMAIYVSEMCPKVADYFRVNMSRRIDGSWEFRGLGALRTVRLDKRLGWPNIVDSQEVIGVEDIPQGRYVEFSGTPNATLALQANRATVPHLQWANAPVLSWSRDRETLKFHLRGHLPVDMTIASCTPSGGVSGARVRVDAAKRTARLTFTGSDTREVTLSCR